MSMSYLVLATIILFLHSVSGQYLANKIKVVTILEAPYTMLSNRYHSDGSHTGQFAGYIPELMDQIAEKTSIKYYMKLVNDGKYGRWDNETLKWNGMIGEVIRGEADIAAAGLTVTKQRNQHVEYTKPFMYGGITGIYKAPEKKHRPQNGSSKWFDKWVFAPFSTQVWIIIIAAYFVTSLSMVVINKFNPYEWGQHTKQPGTDMAGYQDGWLGLNLQGSCWLLFSAFNKQGYERSPKSIAGRVLLASWWLFSTLTLIVYIGIIFHFVPGKHSSYLHEELHEGVLVPNSLNDLHLSDYDYGTIVGGSTYQFFCHSKFEKYQEMCDEMLASDSLVQHTKHGIQRVLEGSYVFLTDFPLAMHFANQDCSLSILHGAYGLRSYAFAVNPSNHELRKKLDTAILELHEDQTLERLYNKWFKNNDQCHNIEHNTSVFSDITKTHKGPKTKPQSQAQPPSSSAQMLNAGLLDEAVRLETEDFPPIDLAMYSTVLGVMVLGLVLAFLAFLAEMIYFKVILSKRHNNMQEASLIQATRLEEMT